MIVVGRLLGAELVMNDLQRACLLDGTVGGGTVGAVNNFARGRIDGFCEGLTLHVLEVRPAETLQVRASIWLVEKNPSTCLADALEDANRVLEVANVKDGDAELDISVVPDTVYARLAARLAERALVSRSQTSIEYTILDRETVCRCVQISVRDLILG